MIADFGQPGSLAACFAILAPVLGIAARLAKPGTDASARWIGVAVMSGSLLASVVVAWTAPLASTALRVDRLGALMAVLIASSAAAAAWSGAAARLRELACLAALLAALFFDSAAVTWLGVHTAIIVTARGGWTGRLPAMVGSATALAGTMLLGAAVASATDLGTAALGWSRLAHGASTSDPAQLSLAIALMLAGYGLAALHALPASISALGGLAVVAAISLRLRALLAATSDAVAPGPLFMAVGLLAASVAAAALWTRREAGQPTRIALASLGQFGVVLYAFGLGGSDATMTGLLHLTMLVLTASAGLCGAGRTRTASTAALALLPPFGLFASAALVVAVTARELPWLVVPVAALLIALALPLALRLGLGDEPGAPRTLAANIPAWLALSLTVVLGLAMPPAVASWMQAAGSSLP